VLTALHDSAVTSKSVKLTVDELIENIEEGEVVTGVMLQIFVSFYDFRDSFWGNYQTGWVDLKH